MGYHAPVAPTEPPATQALLDRAAARHGGWDRWRRLESISLRVESLGGAIPRLKGLHRSFSPPSLVTVEPLRRRLVLHGYPTPDRELVFDRGRVGDAPLDHDTDSTRRARLMAHPRARWSPEDATYFFGYAITHYLGLPFSLAEAEIVEHRHRPGSSRPDRLTVRYAPDAHTHGVLERFHFDATGLLVRHDYHAEVLGPNAHGAHYTRDYVEVDGLMIARRREVYLRMGDWATPLPVLHARLAPLSVSLAAG
jgi:hypothetical protein